MKKRWDFGDFEITAREILASISIIAILLLIGVLISSKISDFQIERNEKYNKSVKIQDTELFRYGMDTNIGNAFVYGELKAVDTVSYPDINGKYMYVRKEKEEYTEHEEIVTHTDEKGNTYTTVETYWSWDYAGEESKFCKQISFCGITFASKKFSLPCEEYIDTIKESSHIRYVYYGIKEKYSGTIFTVLKDNTISDKSEFYNGKNIEQTVDYLETDSIIVLFWIIWILITGATVFGFYYLDNKWLE